MARYAAVDIGSNSVRMMAAEVRNGFETEILAQERQVTRLGEGVFRSGRITDAALTFLCECLGRMASIYGRLNVTAVRAVATSAVRDASNQNEFLKRTSAALNAPVEIISGPEEARLIHLGVEARWQRPHERTLILDVGGGSGELIISHEGHLLDAVSKPLGAVRLTELFLKSDPPSKDELKRLESYVNEKLLPFREAHKGERFDRMVVTSSTAGAIVSAANSIARAKRDEADRLCAKTSQVRDLYALLGKTNLEARRKIVGIGPRRAEIVTGGTYVFLRTLELFDLKSLCYCVAGVRDGIIADLAARHTQQLASLVDEQRDVVRNMAYRYGNSIPHVVQVARLSGKLFRSLQPIHKLPPEAGKLLEAAAYLHDIGHFVSNTGHHKHSAYLVENSDMPGFTVNERLAVAALCRFHRKSMPQSRHLQFQVLDPETKRIVLMLIPLLRLGDALDRGHKQNVQDVIVSLWNGEVTVKPQGSDIELETWAAAGNAAIFRDVYQVPLAVPGVKATTA
jgi:exopolyphosphatase / guanosine-5'-triphosphate,3'-diphosphate pyrophosphatase